MDLDKIAFDRRFGAPVVKDGCGVFGVIRKVDSPLIPESVVVSGISIRVGGHQHDDLFGIGELTRPLGDQLQRPDRRFDLP